MRNNLNDNGKIRRSVFVGINPVKNGFYAAINDRKCIKREFVLLEKRTIEKQIFSWLYNYPVKEYVKIIGVGIIGREGAYGELSSDLWLRQDIAPFVLQSDKAGKWKAAEEASVIVADKFKANNIFDIKFEPRRKVIVQSLARVEDFRKKVPKKEFGLLLRLAEKFKQQKGRIVFFSSTPQGGGVSLMRHALIRLLRQMNVDVGWFVMSADTKVFEITKIKFHNVLQGIAPADTVFSEEDAALYNEWIIKNAKRFKQVFKEADIIVIDDPQPSGMIAYIKKINPETKIIYRSHIQIDTDLIEKKKTIQRKVWRFLWQNIKKADLFISHPVFKFIPKDVLKEKTLLMGASTDNFDGLNKALADRDKIYYLELFNAILAESGQAPLDIKRPYIAQIARFDPSKGIPDAIEAYRKFRNRIEKENWKAKRIPQLVIAGHGSVDDPEGKPIYKNAIHILRMDTYRPYAPDIKIARVSGSDQILNALLRGCCLAFQLSHKEGFEVKVSEALDKGRPVIAYRTGGIPLQIDDGYTGFLVRAGDTAKVAEKIYELLSDGDKYDKISRNAREKDKGEFFTINNAIKWLYLATELKSGNKITGNRRHIRDLIEKHKKIKMARYQAN